ncbi:MAG: phosphatase PAP2 family protein [candidate division Zixibacteria bacterium]|nr:phosphatase PAP2 family protein [candidate division Zixibacteria bacterium]
MRITMMKRHNQIASRLHMLISMTMLLVIYSDVSAEDNYAVSVSESMDVNKIILQERLDNRSTDIAIYKRQYNLWVDFKNIGKNFVSDAGQVYSSPARINKRSALLLGGIITIGGVLYIYDKEIYDAFQRSKNSTLYKPIRKTGENFERLGYMGASNKYLFGGLALSYIVHWDKGVSICSDVLESHFIAGGIKNIANKTFGRFRPHEGRGARYFEFNGGTSFPSGHALNIVQMASIFSHHIGFLPFQIFAYTIAGTVCLERITSDGHWPSDVYFAAVYGWFVSQEILRLNNNRRVKLAPTVGIAGDGLGMVLNISF